MIKKKSKAYTVLILKCTIYMSQCIFTCNLLTRNDYSYNFISLID